MRRLAFGLIDGALSPVARRWGGEPRLNILCYHGIWLGPGHFGSMLFMRPGTFRARLAHLRDRGYEVVSLTEGMARWRAGTVGRKTCVLTIDDGWYGTYRHMLPALKEFGYSATLYAYTRPILAGEPVYSVAARYLAGHLDATARDRFLATEGAELAAALKAHGGDLVDALVARIDDLPDRDARLALLGRLAAAGGLDWADLVRNRVFDLMTPDELADWGRQGLDIQLHTHNHDSCVGDPARLARELAENSAALAGIAPNPLVHFCYPSGEYSPDLYPVLAEAGIESATTTDQGANGTGANPLALRRLMDGEGISLSEFSAELSGATGMFRR